MHDLQLGAAFGNSDSDGDAAASSLQPASPFGAFLKTFGAVQVGGSNLYK